MNAILWMLSGHYMVGIKKLFTKFSYFNAGAAAKRKGQREISNIEPPKYKPSVKQLK